MSTDKRKIGKENRKKILFLLHRFGWLTARQIADAVWPDSLQYLQNSRKTLASLLKEGMLIRRDLPSNSTAYVLSTKGANNIRSICPTAKSGKDLRVKNDFHRALCNSYLIDKMFDYKVTYTEHEILRGSAPCKEVSGKVPDSLFETEMGTTWVEAENTWKSSERTQQIVQFCYKYLNITSLQHLISDPGKYELYLNRVEIVCPNDASVRNIVRAFDRASGISETGLIRIDWEKVISEVWIVRVDMTNGLVWGGEIWSDSVLWLIESELRTKH